MAKRINTPFVTVFGIVCVVAVSAILLTPMIKRRITQRPATVMATEAAAKAESLFKDGKIAEAIEQINTSHRFDPHNKDYCLRRGDMLMATTGEEGYAALVAARKSWQEALEIDPDFKPALSDLLNSYIDQIEVTGNPQISVTLRETAARMLKIDPADARAQAYLHIATVAQWAMGMSKTGAEKTAALAALNDLNKKSPTPDLLYYLVRGKTVLASEQFQDGQADVAVQTLAECRNLMDAATAANPKDPTFNFRVFQGYQMLIIPDRDFNLRKRLTDQAKKQTTSDQPKNDAAPDQQKKDIGASEQELKDNASATAALAVAIKEVKDTDQHFAEYHYAAAVWARQNRHLDEAEKTLRVLYEAHKNDPRARLELARVLAMTGDKAKRDEAIEMLDRPIVLTGSPADRWISLKELRAETLLDLTSLRVSKYTTIPQAQRPALMAQIEKGYNEVKAMATPDNIPLLRLEGLIDELKGDSLSAVEALSRALALVEHSDRNNQIKYDLMFQLANVNRQAGQNRTAEKLLLGILEKYDFDPARAQLADLLLQENNLVEADKQIGVLIVKNPKAPDVLQLKLRLAMAANRPDDVRSTLAQFPEQTFDEKLRKAQLALFAHDFKQTASLIQQLLQERPKDVGLTLALYNIWMKNGDEDRAKKLLAKAIEEDPKEPRYQILTLQNKKDVPQEQLDHMLDDLVLNGDPFSREIELGRRALAMNKYDEALSHANAADQLQADSPATWELRFRVHNQKGDQAMASKDADNLGRLDVDHANGRVYHWLLAMNKGDFPAAITYAREITGKRNEFAQSFVMLAQALEANGQYLEAIAQYQASLERQTTNMDAYIGMAECYDKMSDPDKGREVLARGMQIFPDSVMLREKALAYDTIKDPVAVVKKREKLLADHPDDAENYLALSSVCVHAAERVFAANPERARFYLDEARDTLTKGVGKFPDHLRLNSALAEALFNANRYEAGVKVLQDMAQLPAWKGKTEPKLILGEYYNRAKQAKLAEDAFREAWAVSSNKNIDIELRICALLEEAKRYDDALELLKANADDPRIASQRLHVHITANHTDEALRGLNELITKEPKNIDLLNLMTVVLVDAGRFPEARASAVKALQIDAQNDVALYYQALCEVRDIASGDLKLAVHNFTQIVTTSPRNVQFKMEYAKLLQGVGDLDNAAGQLEDALKVEPYQIDARLKLLDIYLLSRRWPQFEKIVSFGELNPQIGGPKGIWQRAHAYELAAQGKFDDAIPKIREAIAMDPQEDKYARDYLIILLQAKNTTAVLAEAQRAIDAQHHQWWLFHLRGLAYLQQGRKDLALEQLDKALKEIDLKTDMDACQQVVNSIAEVSLDEAIARLKTNIDTNDRWRIELSAMVMRKQDWKAALGYLEPLVARRDKLPRGERLGVLRLAAECHQSLKEFDQSKTFYLEWVALAPNDNVALNNIAYLFAEDLHDPTSAKPYIERAYEAGRKINAINPMIADTYGWILTLSGGTDANRGLSILSEVVDNHKELLDARYHLAKAYIKLNSFQNALTNLNTAMDQIKDMEQKQQTVDPKLKADVTDALNEVKKKLGTASGN